MKLTRLAKFAWGVLFYNLAVILWGAYVRASGSGAGCGSHWPLCNGEVIPTAPQIKTIVEFTHRLSSGLALLLVVALLFWSFRSYPKRHQVRIGAALSVFFMLTEAAVGAGLVLLELVAGNSSLVRAVWMAIHLVNTFLLIAAITLTAWWASSREQFRLRISNLLDWALLGSLLAVMLLGVSGAVTALGDTLFPAQSLSQGLSQDLSPTAHMLLRLRLFHPLIALVSVVGSLCAVGLALYRNPKPWTERFAWTFAVLSATQLALGMLNIVLLAPTWLQMIHLLVADLIWISLVLLTATTLTARLETSSENVVVGTATVSR